MKPSSCSPTGPAMARPDFALSDDNAAAVAEICRRLDGVPLAIELAAARVRALSLAEILDSLHDRFRLLTGGARTAVRRQQTLRASVDWSHALLTEPERVLFRRLAVFLGGFDLDAAHAVAGAGDDASASRYWISSPCWWTSRWWWPTTAGAERGTGCWRRCASTRWKSSASPAKPMPCGRVTVITTRRWPPCSTPRQAAIMSSVSSRPRSRSTTCAPRSGGAAKTPMSGWRWRWRPRCSRCGVTRGRIREGLAWFDAALADLDAQHPEVAAAVRARALADKAVLDAWVGADSLDQAQQALAIARDVDDPALLARALTACGFIAGQGHHVEVARAYFAEAIGLARAVDDRWRLSQILALQAQGAHLAGDPIAVRAAGEEGRDLADAIGDRFNSRVCRFCLGEQQLQGDLAGAAAQFAEVAAEAEAAHDEIFEGDQPRQPEPGTGTPG